MDALMKRSDKMRSFIKDAGVFYGHDCCWPYSASFYLALIIYWLDFFVVNAGCHWASLAAYGIILAYFLHIIRCYFRGPIEKKNAKFFMAFLSAKVILWGFLLFLLYALR